jgi:glucose-6-phosphate 1-dehydrogenase
MPSTNPCALVIFGASGDLAKRKLLPAVYELARQKLLPERFCLMGYARTEMDDERYRQVCREAVQKARKEKFDPNVWSQIEAAIYYVRGDYGSAEDHARLSERLAALDDHHHTAGNRLFYLSTPPETFEPIIQRLGERLQAEVPRKGAYQRIVIEKPFGRDLPTARGLNDLLHQYFAEEQVFRIDHYLGKETVQNLMVLRFANTVFEPLWNHRFIDHVQITVSETLGVGGRGGYYDTSGALRDMVQNHMFQLMSLVAMEPPAGLDAVSIRDEKVKVFKSLRPIRPAAVDDVTVRGQYTNDKVTRRQGDKVTTDAPSPSHPLAPSSPGPPIRAYREEDGVAADSRTETFAALKLYIDNWRWSGMPFYLRTGKHLPAKLSEVVVRFRSPPLTLFQKQCESPVYPNDLIIRVQPEEGISWRMNGKVPGGQLNIRQIGLDFLYRTTFNI